MEIFKRDFSRDNLKLVGVEIKLKNTTLLLIEGYDSFFMCGALDCQVYQEREVLCGKAVGVKTLEELYSANLKDVSSFALKSGIEPGMTVHEAFAKISKEK